MLSKKGQTIGIFLGLVIVMSIFVILSIFVTQEILKIVFLSLAILSFVVGFFLYWHHAYGPNKIRKMLRKIKPLLTEGTIDDLKQRYIEIYQEYMGLSAAEKKNFYTRVERLRETIEEFLRQRKRIEELLDHSGKGTIAEQKKKYEEIYIIYLKLPTAAKQKYYPHLVQWRERLEKGH